MCHKIIAFWLHIFSVVGDGRSGPVLTGLGVTYHGGRAGIEPRDGGRELLPTMDSAVMRSLRMHKVCWVEFATKGKERSLIYESGVGVWIT